MEKKLKEIAQFVGGTVVGDENVVIRNIRGIDEAGEGDITFIANAKYRQKLDTTEASAVLVSPGTQSNDKNLVIVEDPYSCLSRILMLFYPEERDCVTVSKDAFIAEDAKIAANVTIYPGVYIGKGAIIEKGVVFYPGVFIGNHTFIGEDSTLYPNVTVYRGCRIGKRVILHAGVVVGADGFGFANPGVENRKVPQIGIVRIDDDVEIGANTTIDRAALGETWIKRGVKIDNLVMIAHNVVIGENSVIVSQVGISGSTKLGKSVILGGQAGLVGHVNIGDGAMVGAKSGVHDDVPPGQVVSGIGQMPHREWLRMQACLPKLPEIRKTVNTLVKRIKELENKIQELEKPED